MPALAVGCKVIDWLGWIVLGFAPLKVAPSPPTINAPEFPAVELKLKVGTVELLPICTVPTTVPPL